MACVPRLQRTCVQCNRGLICSWPAATLIALYSILALSVYAWTPTACCQPANSIFCAQAKGLSAEYYLYKDEGHGFARPPNKFDFYSRVEQFLSKHLGGRAEPLMQVEGSSVVVMHES